MQIERYPSHWGDPRFADHDAELINRAIPVMHEILALRRDFKVYENQNMTSLTMSCQPEKPPYINHGYHTYYSFIESLAHEFIHAKQYDEGRLWVEEGPTMFDRAIFVFDDQRFPDGANLIKENAPILEKYMTIPWEVEPYAYMTQVAERTLQALGVEYEEAHIVVQGVNLRVLRITDATNPDISPERLAGLYQPRWLEPQDTKPDWKPFTFAKERMVIKPNGTFFYDQEKGMLIEKSHLAKMKKVDPRHWVQEKRNNNWKKFVA